MPRPQFTIRTLLWLTLVVAAFLAGMTTKQQLIERELARQPVGNDLPTP